MDFCIPGSNDWGDDKFSNSLHEQLFGNTTLNSSVSVNTINKKKAKKRKLHESAEYDPRSDNVSVVSVGKNVAIAVTEPDNVPKRAKKKKKKKIISSPPERDFKNILSIDEKQDTKKSKLLQVDDHARIKDMLPVKTENKKFISSSEISEVVPCGGEQTKSEFHKTLKRKRKHTDEPVDSISNKRQKQEEEGAESSLLHSKNKVLSRAKTILLRPSKLQQIFTKYDATTKDKIQETDIQKPGSSILKEKGIKTENKKFISSNEILQLRGAKISEVMPCSGEQTKSEFHKTLKHKKHKRKHIDETVDSISNKRQKQEEEGAESSLLHSKNKVLSRAKTILLRPSKLQQIFTKYDATTKDKIQETDIQKPGSSILKEKGIKTENKKFISSNEILQLRGAKISEVMPCSGEQTKSEFHKTLKHKKHKRKHIDETVDSISNKRQKQEEKGAESSLLDSKNKVLSPAKTSLLRPSKLQQIFTKYDAAPKDKVQETDIQKSGSSILKEKAMKRLEAAKFRFLNEKMYTVTGSEAMEYFKNDSDAFEEYHSGYQSQVKKWPVNPVDLIISDIQKKPKSFVIADLGCGDAKIARIFPNRTVHSFDLVALNDKVTCCNISKVPLSDESVDVAIFCLSLMGTNLSDYILEAHRILKDGGLLKIAEVESRIKDLDEFITNIGKYGFSFVSKDTKHRMFVLVDFHKGLRKVKKSKLPAIQIDPCIYKKR